METTFEYIISDILERGYAIVDDFLPAEGVASLQQTLTNRYMDGYLKKAGIGQLSGFQIDKEVRGDYIMWLDEESADVWEREWFGRIEHFMEYLNRTCYTGLQSCEFHYAIYPKGAGYQRHLDQFQTDSRRRFSVICYLNLEWQENDGGELALYLPEGEKRVLPIGGRLVCFESDKIEHAVLPANRNRLSLTGWLKR